MKKFILFIYIFLALPVIASDLTISDLSIRWGKNSSVYFTINNLTNNMDYLIGAEVVGHPEAIVSINKTVIEKHIARIIKINKLAIPPHYSVKLAPIGIYLVIKNLDQKNSNPKDHKIKLFFEEAESITFYINQ